MTPAASQPLAIRRQLRLPRSAFAFFLRVSASLRYPFLS